MKEKIEKKIEELEELYDEYLRRTEDRWYQKSLDILEKRLHDIRIQINTYIDVLEMIKDGKDNNI